MEDEGEDEEEDEGEGGDAGPERSESGQVVGEASGEEGEGEVLLGLGLVGGGRIVVFARRRGSAGGEDPLQHCGCLGRTQRTTGLRTRRRMRVSVGNRHLVRDG